MKHGTICKIFNDYFDYSGKTKQGYPRGRHLVHNGELVWTCPSEEGNVMSYIWKTTDKKFQIATPEEVEMFNKIVNQNSKNR